MYRSDTYALVARRRALETELEETRRLEAERLTHSLKRLERITVVSTCRERWSRMASHPDDARVRLCRRCQKGVYDIAAFDAAEVEALLESHGTDRCARIYRRPDGTIMTADCPGREVETDRKVNLVLRVCLLLVAAIVAFVFLAARELAASETLGCINVRASTELQVKKYAHEAYARWQLKNGIESCPRDVSELGDLVDQETVDPWGSELVMLCGEDAPPEADGFGVLSLGEDRQLGTDDDIQSWE